MATSTRGTRGTRPAKRFKVYRLRDSDSRVIYLGYTREPMGRRLDRHERQNAWFARVDLTRTLVDAYDNADDMMARYRECRTMARRPAVNGAPVPRRAPEKRTRQASAKPIPGADAPTALERITASRVALREAELAFGSPPGNAYWLPDGSIGWRELW